MLGRVQLRISCADPPCDVIESWIARVVWRVGPPGCPEPFAALVDVAGADESGFPTATATADGSHSESLLPKYTMEFIQRQSLSTFQQLTRVLEKASSRHELPLPARYTVSLLIWHRGNLEAPEESVDCCTISLP